MVQLPNQLLDSFSIQNKFEQMLKIIKPLINRREGKRRRDNFSQVLSKIHTQTGECGTNDKACNHSDHSEAMTPTVTVEDRRERDPETSPPCAKEQSVT